MRGPGNESLATIARGARLPQVQGRARVSGTGAVLDLSRLSAAVRDPRRHSDHAHRRGDSGLDLVALRRTKKIIRTATRLIPGGRIVYVPLGVALAERRSSRRVPQFPAAPTTRAYSRRDPVRREPRTAQGGPPPRHLLFCRRRPAARNGAPLACDARAPGHRLT